MKRRLLAIGMALTMALAGCGKGETAEMEQIVPVDYTEAYVPILDAYYDLIYYGTGREEIVSHTGVMELLTYEGPGEAAKKIGYAIEDISDSIPYNSAYVQLAENMTVYKRFR